MIEKLAKSQFAAVMAETEMSEALVFIATGDDWHQFIQQTEQVLAALFREAGVSGGGG